MNTATELTQEEIEIVEHLVRHFNSLRPNPRNSTSFYGTGIEIKPDQMLLVRDELISRGVLHRCSNCHGVALSTRPFKSCFQCDPRMAEEEYDDIEDDDDEYISTTEVYNRAYAHFGNHELAREASEMYPGDFI